MAIDDSDRTVVLSENNDKTLYGHCPLCGARFAMDQSVDGLLRCSVCRYTQKQEFSVEPGSIIGGKYRVLSPLDEGGFGKIFICHPLSDMQTRYVLKILRGASRQNSLRFKREASILSTISNKRITRIYDYWDNESEFLIVMEYVNGKNLLQLKNDYVFDEGTVLAIAREVVLGLKDIWEQYAVIHRDIKPANIMLDENQRIKILDFGLSKQCGCENDSLMNFTMANACMGTPGFMSPEQFSDFKNVDFRTDIFSLGATMFFLLTDQKPFSGTAISDIHNSTLKNSPPPVEKFGNSCSKEVIALISKMMQFKPQDRYADYDSLLADIDACLEI